MKPSQRPEVQKTLQKLKQDMWPDDDDFSDALTKEYATADNKSHGATTYDINDDDYYEKYGDLDDYPTSFDFGLVANLSGDERTPVKTVDERNYVHFDEAYKIITDYIKTLTQDEKDRFYLNWSWGDYGLSGRYERYDDIILNVYRPDEYKDDDGSVNPHSNGRFFRDEISYKAFENIRRLLNAF